MRIVVNDIAASKGGAMTVLRDFYTWVCAHDHENEWIFLLNDRYFEETENIKIRTLPQIKKSRWKKLAFDLLTGRKYIHALEPDVVLSLQNIITFGLKVPQAVYIHQSIPFQSVKRFSFLRASERKLAVIQHLIGGLIKLSARKSGCVIVQTKWMGEAVCDMCRIPRSRVLTSLPRVTIPADARSDAALDPTRFFCPTSEAIYKNNACIAEASALLEKRGVAHGVTLTLPSERSRGRLECVGRLPYETLLDYYQRTVLVFPSYIETFGYPLAEARAAGTIVLASDTAFSREVLEGYENAYFFDPFRPEELAALMEQVAAGDIQIKRMFSENAIESGNWDDIIHRLLLMCA